MFTPALKVFEILTFQVFGLHNIGQVTECNINNDAARWRILISTGVIMLIFTLALIISEILTFKNVDLDHLDQGHWVQRP